MAEKIIIELELDAASATNAPSQQCGSKLAVDALVDGIFGGGIRAWE